MEDREKPKVTHKVFMDIELEGAKRCQLPAMNFLQVGLNFEPCKEGQFFVIFCEANLQGGWSLGFLAAASTEQADMC